MRGGSQTRILSRNQNEQNLVVLSGLSFSLNVVGKRAMLSVRAVYVLSSPKLRLKLLLFSLIPRVTWILQVFHVDGFAPVLWHVFRQIMVEVKQNQVERMLANQRWYLRPTLESAQVQRVEPLLRQYRVARKWPSEEVWKARKTR
jgi:hypothetical protein